jgi:hypothetical protein
MESATGKIPGIAAQQCPLNRSNFLTVSGKPDAQQLALRRTGWTFSRIDTGDYYRARDSVFACGVGERARSKASCQASGNKVDSLDDSLR